MLEAVPAPEAAKPPGPPATTAALEARVAALEAKLRELEPRTVSNRVTIIVFSGDMDKVVASLVIATGAAAMGMQVSLFHTFWGLMPLRKARSFRGKNLLQNALQVMTPAGMGHLSPSKLAFAGAGAKIFRKLMRDEQVQSPEELFQLAREMGVKVMACQMSMDVMGIRQDELLDGLEVAGVGAYLADAADSRVTLFI
jgi:peroxiredoxin family protein